jgi:hypothetical protein
MGKFDITVYDLQSDNQQSNALILVDVKKLNQLIKDGKKLELQLEKAPTSEQICNELGKYLKDDFVSFDNNTFYNYDDQEICSIRKDMGTKKNVIVFEEDLPPKVVKMIAEFYESKVNKK